MSDADPVESAAEVGADILAAAATPSHDTARPLEFGEMVLLFDQKGRRYLLTLEDGREFHSHAGILPHAELVGRGEGTQVRTSAGTTYRAFRPTLADYIFKMPRGAQVIYPKDLGAMLMLADVSEGTRVLESGVGSGALSMAMLRCGANIVGYELREDFANRARANVRKFLGDGVMDRYRVELRDTYDGIDERYLDRVVLDLPEPWRVVEAATTALRSGGIFVAYTPSITQVMQLRSALDNAGFLLTETLEVLHRTWHVEGQAVRPDHRMVAHTGFITHARSVG